jgi:hypothetical protein
MKSSETSARAWIETAMGEAAGVRDYPWCRHTPPSTTRIRHARPDTSLRTPQIRVGPCSPRFFVIVFFFAPSDADGDASTSRRRACVGVGCENASARGVERPADLVVAVRDVVERRAEAAAWSVVGGAPSVAVVVAVGSSTVLTTSAAGAGTAVRGVGCDTAARAGESRRWIRFQRTTAAAAAAARRPWQRAPRA